MRRFLLVAAALLAALTGAIRSSAQPPSAGALVLPEGGSVPVRVEEVEGRSFVSVQDVVAALQGTVAYDEKTRSYEVRIKTHSAVFGLDTPIAVVDTRLVTLTSPVRAQGASVSAEPDFFQKVLGPVLGLSFSWDKAARVLSARKVEVPEVNVETTVADVGDTTRVVLRFSQPPDYRVERTDDQVLLKFPGIKLVTGTTERLVEGPRVARLLVRGSEVSIALKDKALAANVYPLGNPPRLVVDVGRGAAPTAVPGAPVAAPLSPSASKAKTVVLDAGHGGTEEGAKGPDGTLEKDATLALVRTMQEALTRRGYRVVTTRSSDATVGLEDRAATANGSKADVFLSIHCNASRSATAHGTEVYYLSLDASDRAAAALAEAENKEPTPTAQATAEKNAALRDLDLILWDLAQNQHLAASARLAEIVQADFNRLLRITTRGVKQAPFRVLIGVNAPAVLVEVAFITNPDEEKKLASEEFRRQTAETLAGSLDQFFRAGDAVAPVPYAPKAASGNH